ncbi:hypothetical protein L6164_031100 [Bauhinia variegata]|uniref:Uncharacterized protein n=1 Tax=Bauhinia variegata TaxID=167791 RepID=A0ACB9LFR0_BAUVA|nr:hypothetical protein L6164_031100 [Bauhinia variegata]
MMSSSTLSTIFILAAFVSLSSLCNIAAQPGCSEKFATLAHQKNLTINCKKLRTLGAELGWSYHRDPNFTQLNIFFGARVKPPHADTSRWLAWGVNPGKRPEMIGTNAIIGIVHENGSMIVNSYEISNETKIDCRLLPSETLGGIRVINKEIKYDDKSKFYTIFASLDLPSDQYNIAKLNHVWQVGYNVENNVEPKKHPITLQNFNSKETVDLTSSSGRSTSPHRRSLREVHGILNIVGWGTLIPIGVIVTRYFRVYPFQQKWWFKLHIFCQTSGYLIGTAGWAIGLWLGHASVFYKFYAHRLFAIFIFMLATLQMLALCLRPNVRDTYRKYWNMYHHLVGYTLLTLIFINIFKGISILKGDDWKWAYVGILGVLGAIALGFEFFCWVKFVREKIKKKPTPDE